MMYNSRIKKNKKNKNLFISILASVVGIVVVMYILSIINIPVLSNINGYAIHIISSIKASVEGVIEHGTNYFGDIHKLYEENKQMKLQIDNLYYETLDMELIKKDNETLRQMLKIDESYSFLNKVYANVILTNLDNYSNTIVIDKGIKAGVKLKQTVITSQGLVGYVSNVSDYTSIITTILDTSFAASVQISSINKLALSRGDYDLMGKKQLKLINIPIDTEISANENVYTSGIGIYEKGIKVGKIHSVVNKKNEIDRYAIIEPAVDFDTLTVLAVVVGE